MKRVALPVIEVHGGSVVKAEADNIFCVFTHVSEAVTASHEIIRHLEVANRILPSDRQLGVSIGIGYGEGLILEHDMFGDEMNVACKLGEDIGGRNDVLLTQAAAEAFGENVEPHDVSISGLSLKYYTIRP